MQDCKHFRTSFLPVVRKLRKTEQKTNASVRGCVRVSVNRERDEREQAEIRLYTKDWGKKKKGEA